MKIKKHVLFIGLVIFILLVVSSYFTWNSFSKRVVDKSNKEATEKQAIIDQLEIDKRDILIELEELEKRNKYLKENPTIKIKKVPVIKYKTIEKIKYVESSKYEEAWKAWEDCDRKFTLCMDNYDDMNLNYKHYIDNCEKQKVELKKQVNIFRDARDLLAARNKSIHMSLSISVLSAEVGLYNLNDTMQVYKNNWDNSQNPHETKAIRGGYIFSFVNLRFTVLKKDLIRKDLFK
jgi:predicted ATP-binding protein involved in virulence